MWVLKSILATTEGMSVSEKITSQFVKPFKNSELFFFSNLLDKNEPLITINVFLQYLLGCKYLLSHILHSIFYITCNHHKHANTYCIFLHSNLEKYSFKVFSVDIIPFVLSWSFLIFFLIFFNVTLLLHYFAKWLQTTKKILPGNSYYFLISLWSICLLICKLS